MNRNLKWASPLDQANYEREILLYGSASYRTLENGMVEHVPLSEFLTEDNPSNEPT